MTKLLILGLEFSVFYPFLIFLCLKWRIVYVFLVMTGMIPRRGRFSTKFVEFFTNLRKDEGIKVRLALLIIYVVFVDN